MDHDVALVLAGGLIGLVSSVVALFLQRRWTVHDRQASLDREALDLATRALLAWHDVALGILSGKADTDAAKRLHELDVRWEADPRLIPDRDAAEELLRRCRSVYFMPRAAREGTVGTEELDRIMRLGARVRESAQERRRELA